MLITWMFSVVAMKSRTFSSLPYSGNEQVCRSWEGAQPGRQHKVAGGNIPYHGRHAPFVNGGGLYAFLLSRSCELESFLVRVF